MKKLLLILCVMCFGWAAGQGAAPPPIAVDESDVQDVLYLGAGRPAILRLHLRRHGRNHLAHWETLMSRLFQQLDRNQSGDLDLLELARSPLPAQLSNFFQGNIYIFYRANLSVSAMPFDSVDVDRDGKVSLLEYKDYCRKNGAGPVSIATVPYYNYALSDMDADGLFGKLDTNKDGNLSKNELQAAEQLFRYDENDDELITRAELSDGGFNPYQVRALRSMTAPAQTGTSSLLLISRETDGKRMTGHLATARELMTRFDKDKNNRLSPSECSFSQTLFARLDRNKDEQLDVLELVRWLSGPPDAEFTLNLGNSAAMPAKRTSDEREMAISLGTARLSVAVGATSLGYDLTQTYLEQFRNLDKDKVGYISRTRAGPPSGGINAIFDIADRNGDGRLTEEELKSFLSLAREANGAQVSLTLASLGRGLFQTLDANGDGMLSMREIRNAWKGLSRYDNDGDGVIGPGEFVAQYRLSVGAVSYQGVLATPSIGRVATAPARMSTRGPLWFRKMDTNGDGDVSRREWLGKKEEFDAIDADKDDLLSVEEAERADARARR